VNPESAAIRRSIPTPNHLTGKRALLRVNAHVTLEMTTLRRSIPTPNHLASKGALLRVCAHVNHQSATFLCCIATAWHVALVGALLCHIFNYYRLAMNLGDALLVCEKPFPW
jgi:hypothetical protein